MYSRELVLLLSDPGVFFCPPKSSGDCRANEGVGGLADRYDLTSLGLNLTQITKLSS